MKLNEKELHFLTKFKSNFSNHSLWSQNQIIKHYKISKVFIYTLLNKLGFKKWKAFLVYIASEVNFNSKKSQSIEIENLLIFINHLERNKLYITGLGYSKISGYELLYFIDKHKTNSHMIDIKKEWTWKFMDNKMSNSTYLIYSSKGKSNRILNFLKYIKSLENNIIFCVTDNRENIYQPYVDYFLYSNLNVCDYSQNLNLELSPIIPQILVNQMIKEMFLQNKL